MNTIEHLSEYYFQAAKEAPDGVAFAFPSPTFEQQLSWRQVWDLGSQQATYLKTQGIQPGDRVGIHARTGWEWEVAQLALFIVGATVVGIDPNESEINFEKIRKKINMKAVLVDEHYLREKWQANCGINLPLFELLKNKTPSPQPLVSAKRSTEEEALIIFTSGTTSEPKGISYTHKKVIYAIARLQELYPEGVHEKHTLCWLPLANLFQRMNNYVAISHKITIYFVSNPIDVIRVLPQIKPKIFISVPRFYEKIYDTVMLGVGYTAGKLCYHSKYCRS